MIVTMVFLMTVAAYAIETPVNVEISHTGSNVTISWSPVNNANSYKVYTRETPYGQYEWDENGTFTTATSWTKTESDARKFYKVTAVARLAPVNLGTAENYAVLAESGISSIPSSTITGHIGLSPSAASFVTGFSLTMHSSGTYSTSTQVIGNVYAADYADPTPSNLTTAIGDMELAYTDAAGRITPDFLNLGAGDITGLNLAPGLYKWGTGILISSAVTLTGGPNDIWIFQIA